MCQTATRDGADGRPRDIMTHTNQVHLGLNFIAFVFTLGGFGVIYQYLEDEGARAEHAR